MDGDRSDRTQREKILARLDHMVAAGRVTPDEAARLRDADDAEEFELAMGAIRARHAGARLNAAVDSGHMTRGDADEWKGRLRAGDHPRELRGLLRDVGAGHDEGATDPLRD